MTIAFYTYDLYQGREHLMPWRTILEVANVMKLAGQSPVILNACYCGHKCIDYEWRGLEILGIGTGYSVLAEFVDKMNCDALFIPFTWRDCIKNMNALKNLRCKKIAYMAGGVYDFGDAWTLMRYAGMTWARPYFLESIMPKRLLPCTLNRAGFNKLIGLTPYTTKCVMSAGLKHAVTIVPGKDKFDTIVPDYSLVERYQLSGKKWLLFSGAPAPTRGAEMLIKAIDRAMDNDIRLVMLMRTDVGSEYDRFNKTYAQMIHPERVMILREKLTREQLKAFFESAWYALLPFIVIPSEVPLTYFELLQCGTPVITFPNGGTTEYLKNAMVVAKKSVRELAKTLDEIWHNASLREQKSIAALEIMNIHPTWNAVGEAWFSLIGQ